MDTKELKELISLQVKMIKARLEKIKPTLQGRSVEMFITFQPLRNVNPNDPEDPIPWRTDPNAILTQYERELLGEQFKIAHGSIIARPPSAKGSWDPGQPLWKALEKTDTYKEIKPWILYCSNHMVTGTCTSRFKIESQLKPLVKRGTPGKIIDTKAISMLSDSWVHKLKKVPSSMLMVIFNGYLYFIDPKRLNKLKYDLQTTMF